MTKMTVACREFRPRRKGALLGFADIHIAEIRLLVRDVAIFRRNGRTWAQLPGKPKVGADGTVIRDTAGKVAYAAILEFDSKAVASAFSEAVIAAVLRLDEHALNPVPAGVA